MMNGEIEKEITLIRTHLNESQNELLHDCDIVRAILECKKLEKRLKKLRVMAEFFETYDFRNLPPPPETQVSEAIIPNEPPCREFFCKNKEEGSSDVSLNFIQMFLKQRMSK